MKYFEKSAYKMFEIIMKTTKKTKLLTLKNAILNINFRKIGYHGDRAMVTKYYYLMIERVKEWRKEGNRWINELEFAYQREVGLSIS